MHTNDNKLILIMWWRVMASCLHATSHFLNQCWSRSMTWLAYWCLNTLRPRQNGRYFADDIFKCIFFNENIWISLKISLKFVPKVRVNNISQAGKLALTHSPMRVKIWPGEWKTCLGNGILYRVYKRLPSSGECRKIFVSQPDFIIGSENGLAPTRRQAIIWTNGG